MSKRKRSALGDAPGDFPDILGSVIDDSAPKPKAKAKRRAAKARKAAPKPAEPPQRTTLLVPGELHMRLKLAAVEDRTTVTALLLEGAELALKKRAKR